MLKEKVGDIVAKRLSLASIFERYNIDYCCGGKQTLEEACQAKKLDPQVVLRDLKTALSEPTIETDWRQSTLSLFIDHIQNTHHVYLKEALPRLTALIDKVVRAHGTEHVELKEMQNLFVQFRAELEAHMNLEDTIIFPIIKSLEQTTKKTQVEKDALRQQIAVLIMEHDEVGKEIDMLKAITHGYVAPTYACTTYRVMLEEFKNLEHDLHCHVHKENNILIPRTLSLLERTP